MNDDDLPNGTKYMNTGHGNHMRNTKQDEHIKNTGRNNEATCDDIQES